MTDNFNVKLEEPLMTKSKKIIKCLVQINRNFSNFVFELVGG